MKKANIFNFLISRNFILFILSACALLSYFTGGLGYIAGIIVALIAFWASRFSWIEFGISRPDWLKTIGRAIILSIGIFILMDIIIQPIIENYFDQIDLTSLSDLKGNFTSYILFILFMWIVAGFGEEFLYRGYFMKRLAMIFGDTNTGWLLSAVVISILFGLAHLYQGISGVVTTGIIGFILSMIFYKNRKNLVLGMLTHGLYDMIGITLIYLGKERIIVDWIHNHLM